MTDVISVTGLKKSFKDVNAVDDISFEVKAGQCFGLLGPNGAGKTTTIEMLEGMLSPDAGEILYYGQGFSEQIRDKIGIQFQHTALQDYLTTKETIELFRSFYKAPLSTDELMTLCDLEDFAKQDHRKLSGGQRQRLLLALALVNDPQILFLDEPTTGLDPHARRNFWTLIERIKGQGTTILLTTHYMDEAEQLCDEIIIMDKGKIIQRGAPKALLTEHFPGVLVRLKKPTLDEQAINSLGFDINGDFIEQTTQDMDGTLSVLMNSQLPLDGMQIKTANLDDLFLKLTGHGLRDSDD